MTSFCTTVLLGGPGVVVSGVVNPLIWVIIVTLLITPLITTHEPPSTVLLYLGRVGWGARGPGMAVRKWLGGDEQDGGK